MGTFFETWSFKRIFWGFIFLPPIYLSFYKKKVKENCVSLIQDKNSWEHFFKHGLLKEFFGGLFFKRFK